MLGAAGTAASNVDNGDTDMGVGRYVIPFTNEIAESVTKRYLRLYVTIAGSVATGINFVANLHKKN